jgi:hypothetical protein
MDAARERVLPRLAEALLQIEVGDVLGVVHGLDLDPGVGETPGIVRADVRRNPGVGRVDRSGSRRGLCHAGKDSWSDNTGESAVAGEASW